MIENVYKADMLKLRIKKLKNKWKQSKYICFEYEDFFDEVKKLDLPNLSSLQKASRWDPLEFNSFINKYRQKYSDELKSVHRLEFNFLFDLCCEKALS